MGSNSHPATPSRKIKNKLNKDLHTFLFPLPVWQLLVFPHITRRNAKREQWKEPDLSRHYAPGNREGEDANKIKQQQSALKNQVKPRSLARFPCPSDLSCLGFGFYISLIVDLTLCLNPRGWKEEQLWAPGAATLAPPASLPQHLTYCQGLHLRGAHPSCSLGQHILSRSIW